VTPYLLFSTLVHAVVLAALVFVVPAVKKEKTYYAIDFVGGQSGEGPGRLEPAPAPSGGRAENVEAPQTEETGASQSHDDKKVSVKKEDKKGKKDVDKKKKIEEGTQKAPRNRGMKGGRGESADGKGDIMGAKTGAVGGAGISLEIGGFGPGAQTGQHSPYSWYSNIVSKRIWEAWDRSDASNKECVIAFSIQRDGALKGVKIDETSGDAIFDITAKRAVEDAAPFPPLPDTFPESKLQVYMKFRLQ
jgi:TonB family protein